MIGEFEQLVLMAILRIGKGAYGIPVRDEITRRTRRQITLGAIYKTLGRLDQKGFVVAFDGPPSPHRGGRRTRCYQLTAVGKRELAASLRLVRQMAAGLAIGDLS